MARKLSGQSVRTVCERSWVRVPVGPCAFSSPVTFGGSVWVRAWAASSKGIVSSVPAWFRADSGTNLIKQGEIVTCRQCGSVAQWSECSHGMREVLGSNLIKQGEIVAGRPCGSVAQWSECSHGLREVLFFQRILFLQIIDAKHQIHPK